MIAHVCAVGDQVTDVRRAPDFGDAAVALAGAMSGCGVGRTARKPEAIQVICNSLAGLLLLAGHAVDCAHNLGFAQLASRDRILADYQPAGTLLSFLAVAIRYDTAQPNTRHRLAFCASDRALPDDFSLVSSEAREHGYHQAANRGLAIKLFRHAPNAHAALLKFGDRVQCEAGLSAEAIQFVNEELIEFL